MVCKIIFCSEFLDIPDKAGGKTRRRRRIRRTQAIAKRYAYAKSDKYLLFIKVGATNHLLKLNYLLSRVDTIPKDHIYHTKQYQAFYRKIKYDLLNFRGIKMDTKIFNIRWFLFLFS